MAGKPPVSKGVAKQIAARKAVIEKTANRTSDDLLYMNAKTGWIKLQSSVNTLSDNDIARLAAGEDPINVLGSPITAGYNVLMGGLLRPDRGLREGINTTPTDAATGVVSNYAYQNRAQSTGIRPMPGITSMNVKSKGTYGTLREADVSFSVWTLEDFELMEQVYLRPGFTMLLEWGHSMYLTNDGKLSTEVETIGNRFYRPGVRMAQILNEIADLRQKSSYNYEGMIGYVKNFSWTYNANGGYDCTVSIISAGEIIESIQLRFDPRLRVKDKALFDDPNSDEGKEQLKSMFHFLITKIAPLTGNTFTKADLQAKAGDVVADLEDFTGYYLNAVTDTGLFQGDFTPMHWISLRTFLDIFNKCIVPVDRTKLKDLKDRSLTRFNTDYEHSDKFVTSDEHFSIDPTVCVLVKAARIGSTTLLIEPIHTSGGSIQGTTDDILNIYISIPFIKTTLDAALNKDGHLDKSMHDILTTLLEGVNTALGGINDIGISFNDELDGGSHILVDRNNTPPGNIENPVFTLAGIGSVFTDVSISSKISNEAASQISIAAQASAKNTTTNVENILRWNSNSVDRLKVTKSDKTDETDTAVEDAANLEERTQEWLANVVDTFDDFNSWSGYDPEDMESIKTMHAEWTVTNVLKKARIQNKLPLPQPIPVELSFKLDGIGGLKLAETFTIADGILPRTYQNRIGYLITGLEHNIGTDNKWETSVTTQFYLIEQPSDAEVAAAGSPPAIAGLNPALQNNGSIPNSGVSTSKGGATKVIDGVTYKNGQLPPDKLVAIANQAKYKGDIRSDGGQIRLYPRAATALNKLLAAATAGKVDLKINSAYRTVPDQKKTFQSNCTNSADSMQRCIPKPGEGPAAIPGTSNHGFGLAVDFANSGKKRMNTSMPEYAWLAFNAAQYGFKRIASEAWHWEYQI